MQISLVFDTGGARGDSAILNASRAGLFRLELVLQVRRRLLPRHVLDGLGVRELDVDAVLHLLLRGDDGELVGRPDGRLVRLTWLRLVLERY